MRRYLTRFFNFTLCIILVFSLSGCNNKTKIDEKVNQFNQFITQEDYGFATKVYIENSNESSFTEKIKVIIEDRSKEIIDNINSNNLANAKAFVEFLDSTKYSSFKTDILKKIEEIEVEEKQSAFENDKNNNISLETNKEEIAADNNKDDYVPKLDIVNDYSDFSYKKYYNSRFGYSIEYPSFLINEMGCQNNSGVTLSNDNNSVRLNLWANNNALFLTLQEVYNNALNEAVNVTYKSLGSKSFVISGEDGDYIYYMNEVVGEGSMNGFSIRYPKKDEKFFDDIVTKLYNTFNTPGVEECW